MAYAVNKVILIGNLGQDPEMRYTGSGTPVCNMRLATTERYKDASGETADRTEWHNIVAWDRLAEICGEYLRKGSLVYIEGRLQTRSYEDRDKNTRYITEIRAWQMGMLDSRGEGGAGGSGFSEGGAKRSRNAPAASEAPAEDAAGPEPDDDLPF